MSRTQRLDARHLTAIQEIAHQEGRTPRNVLDLLLDRGLASRALGNWPTPITRQHHQNNK
jgi:hypothetical protein